MDEKDFKNDLPLPPSDRIEGTWIILDGKGKFPKSVKINLGYCWKEYRLIKTENNGFILTK